MHDEFNEDDLPETVEAPKPSYDHERLKRMFREAVEGCADNDKLCIQDREFYDGDQLSAETISLLKKRGQPLIHVNKVQPALMGIMGIIDAGESDPEAMARNRNAREAADIATKTLRFIADNADYKDIRKQTSKEFLVEGTCAVLIEAEPNSVTLHAIPWSDFFYDPHSKRTNFADARYMGIAKWLDADQIKAEWPEQYKQLSGAFENMNAGGIFDEKAEIELRKVFVDPQRRRLRVIDMYYVDADGQWHRCLFCDSVVLWCGESEYVNDKGESICPIEAESYEVKLNGDRYGAVRNMVPLQSEINSRRSKLLHLVNHRQVMQTDMNVPQANAGIAKKEAAKADGAIPYGWKPVQAPDLAQGQMIILQQSMADLDRMAPTPAVLGRISSSNESGRARQILQQAGYTELARAIGRFEAFEHRVYKQLWFRARQFFDAPMWVRVTQQGRAPDFILVNEPVTQTVMQPVADPMTGQAMLDPLGRPVLQPVEVQTGVNNRIAEMDMDIVLTTVPDTTTLRQEVWEQILSLAGSLGITPLDPAFRAILKVSPLPNATEAAEELAEIAESLKSENAEGEAMQQQAAMAQMQSELQKTQAKAMRDASAAKRDEAETAKTSLETLLMQQRGPFDQGYLY